MTIKLEIGKEYKLRNGRRAKAIYKKESGTFVLILYNDDKPHRSEEVLSGYEPDGKHFQVPNRLGPLDVISEWPETKVFEKWLLITEAGQIARTFNTNPYNDGFGPLCSQDGYSVIHVRQEYEVGQCLLETG